MKTLIKHLVGHYHSNRIFKLPKKYKCNFCLKRYACPKALKKHVCPERDNQNKNASNNTSGDTNLADRNSVEGISKVSSKTLKPSVSKTIPKRFQAYYYRLLRIQNRMATRSVHQKASNQTAPMAMTDKPLFKSENEPEPCMETDINSTEVDIKNAASLKHQTIKQEPPEIHEDKLNQTFEITCEESSKLDQNEKSPEKGLNDSLPEYEGIADKIQQEFKCMVDMQGANQNESADQNYKNLPIQAKVKNGTLTCVSCSRDFANQAVLRIHIKINHPELFKIYKPPSYKCLRCDKIFAKPNALFKHELTHRQDGLVLNMNDFGSQLECVTCSRYFTTQAALMNHTRVAHPDEYKILKKPKHICAICGQECPSPSKLARHTATHKKGAFSQQEGGQTQVLSSEAIRNNILWCEVCAKPCASKTEYSNHVWAEHCDHSDMSGLGGSWVNNAWTCHGKKCPKSRDNKCIKKFANRSGLTIHIRATHPELFKTLKTLIYKCKYCIREFSKPNLLAKHAANHRAEAGSNNAHIDNLNKLTCEHGCSDIRDRPDTNLPDKHTGSNSSGVILGSEQEDTNMEPVAKTDVEKPMKFEDIKIDPVVEDVSGTNLEFEDSDQSMLPIKKEHTIQDGAELDFTFPNITLKSENQGIQNQCEICNACFKTIQEKKNHMHSIHQYKCSKCSRYFSNSKRLAKHEATHNVNGALLKKYTCVGCGEELATRDEYTRHIIDEHSDHSVTNGSHELQDLTCDRCSRNFANKAALTNHLRIEHPDLFKMKEKRRYKCKFCSKHYDKPSKLAVHVATHKDIKPSWDGPRSNQVISTKDALMRKACDVNADHGVKKESVKALLTLIKEKRNRKRSIRQYKCVHCTRQFDSLKRLEDHKTTHSKEETKKLFNKQYKFVGCGQQIATKDEYTQHIIDEHSDQGVTNINSPSDGLNDLTCKQCKMYFANKAALTYHIRLHHPELFKTLKKCGYKCKLCSKQFEKPYKLAAHAATHNRAKPSWDCRGCEQNFLSRDLLMSHIRNVHADPDAENKSDTKSWKCRFCENVYDRPLSLAKHAATHAGFKKYHCKEQYCDYGAHDKTTLLGHVRRCHTHDLPFICQHCGLKFELSVTLNRHIRRKHPHILAPIKRAPFRQLPKTKREKLKIPCKNKGIFTCHYCAKTYSYSFALHEHIRTHHLGIRYPCAECNRTFSSKASRADHIKSLHSNITPYRCVRCGQYFALRNQLRKHQNRIRKCAPLLTDQQDEENAGKETGNPTGQESINPIDQLGSNSLNQLTYAMIGQQAISSIAQQTIGSIGQQGMDLVGQQISHPLADLRSDFICQQPVGQIRDNLIGQQVADSIDQQSNDSTGKQTIDMTHPQTRDSIGQESNNLIGPVQKPKIHPCDFCNKSFTSKQGLHFHRQGQHLGERKYKCSFSGCQKGFTKMNVLREHERLHSDVFEFSCALCGQRFKQRAQYHAHMRRKTSCQPK